MFRRLAAAALAAPFVVLALPAAAQHAHGAHGSAAPAATSVVKAGSLTIEALWTRATPQGARVAGGYLKITNAGPQTDRLIGGTLPQAGRFEVHEMAVANGVMTMRELAQGLEIPPGQSVELKPGGFHVMFMDLREPLRQGAPIRGTLVFERAGTVEVSWQVAPIGARAPGAHAH